MKLFFFITFFLLIQPFWLIGQKENNDTILKQPSNEFCYLRFFDSPILNLNIQQGWRTMGEVAFGLADYQGGRKLLGLNFLQDIEIGSQFSFNPKHFIIGPELSYNVSFLLFSFGASIIYLTDFRKGERFI